MARTIIKQIRMDQREKDKLAELATRTCLSESSLIRVLISGAVLKEQPDREFFIVMDKLLEKLDSLEDMIIDEEDISNMIAEIRELRVEVFKKYLDEEKDFER